MRILELAHAGKEKDLFGYQAEFIQLVEKCSLPDSIRSKGN